MTALFHTGHPAELNVVGDPAPLIGQTCLQVICTAFVEDGVVTDEANEILIRTAGGWTQLCFDCGLVFWRPGREAPEPYAAELDSGEASIVLNDIAAVRGQVITAIETDIGDLATIVVLRFDRTELHLIASAAEDVTQVRLVPAKEHSLDAR